MKDVMRVAMLGTLGLLTGCFGPSLEGDWVGEVECGGQYDGAKFDVEAELESQGGGEYEGELWMVFEDSITQDGDRYEIEIDIGFELVVETDGRGEQELDHDVELDDVNCRFYQNGSLVSSSCSELGVEVDIGASGDLGDLTWDGQDEITIEDDDCEGAIERD